MESSLGMFSNRMRTPRGLANARRCSMEVMAASNFFSLKLSFGRSEMLHQKTKWNLFGNFEGALDFVHGVDAGGTVGRCDVDRRRPGASPLVVGVERRVNRMERNPAAAEPVGNFLDVLPCG